MLTWTMKHPQATIEMLGSIPGFLDDSDPRPARIQFDHNYGFAGGWRPFAGFTMLPDGKLAYPGDPPMELLAETNLRHETIRVYDCSWVVIIQPDGSFEACRLD